jgi:hypothetical protein
MLVWLKFKQKNTSRVINGKSANAVCNVIHQKHKECGEMKFD